MLMEIFDKIKICWSFSQILKFLRFVGNFGAIVFAPVGGWLIDSWNLPGTDFRWPSSPTSSPSPSSPSPMSSLWSLITAIIITIHHRVLMMMSVSARCSSSTVAWWPSSPTPSSSPLSPSSSLSTLLACQRNNDVCLSPVFYIYLGLKLLAAFLILFVRWVSSYHSEDDQINADDDYGDDVYADDDFGQLSIICLLKTIDLLFSDWISSSPERRSWQMFGKSSKTQRSLSSLSWW